MILRVWSEFLLYGVKKCESKEYIGSELCLFYIFLRDILNNIPLKRHIYIIFKHEVYLIFGIFN